MTDTVNSQATPRLKVMPLVLSSYRTVFGNLGALAQMLWLVVGLNFFYVYYQFIEMEKFAQQVQLGNLSVAVQLGSSSFFGSFIGGTLGLLLLSGVMVAIHRFVLVGVKPIFPGFGIARRELRFCGYFLAVNFMFVVVAMVPMLLVKVMQQFVQGVVGNGGGMIFILSIVAMVAFLIGIITVMTRMSFVLPAIAMDQEGGLWHRFDHAWKAAKGHTATMITALFLALLPWGIISSIGSYYIVRPSLEKFVITGVLPATPMMINSMISIVFGWVAIVLSTVIYSHAYRILEDIQTNTAKSQVVMEPQ